MSAENVFTLTLPDNSKVTVCVSDGAITKVNDGVTETDGYYLVNGFRLTLVYNNNTLTATAIKQAQSGVDTSQVYTVKVGDDSTDVNVYNNKPSSESVTLGNVDVALKVEDNTLVGTYESTTSQTPTAVKEYTLKVDSKEIAIVTIDENNNIKVNGTAYKDKFEVNGYQLTLEASGGALTSANAVEVKSTSEVSSANLYSVKVGNDSVTVSESDSSVKVGEVEVALKVENGTLVGTYDSTTSQTPSAVKEYSLTLDSKVIASVTIDENNNIKVNGTDYKDKFEVNGYQLTLEAQGGALTSANAVEVKTANGSTKQAYTITIGNASTTVTDEQLNSSASVKVGDSDISISKSGDDLTGTYVDSKSLTPTESNSPTYTQSSYVEANINNEVRSTINNISLDTARAYGNSVNCPTTYWFVVYAKDGDNYSWVTNGENGKSGTSDWFTLYNIHTYVSPDPIKSVTFYFCTGEESTYSIHLNDEAVTLEFNADNSLKTTSYTDKNGKTYILSGNKTSIIATYTESAAINETTAQTFNVGDCTLTVSADSASLSKDGNTLTGSYSNGKAAFGDFIFTINGSSVTYSDFKVDSDGDNLKLSEVNNDVLSAATAKDMYQLTVDGSDVLVTFDSNGKLETADGYTLDSDGNITVNNKVYSLKLVGDSVNVTQLNVAATVDSAGTAQVVTIGSGDNAIKLTFNGDKVSYSFNGSAKSATVSNGTVDIEGITVKINYDNEVIKSVTYPDFKLVSGSIEPAAQTIQDLSGSDKYQITLGTGDGATVVTAAFDSAGNLSSAVDSTGKSLVSNGKVVVNDETYSLTFDSESKNINVTQYNLSAAVDSTGKAQVFTLGSGDNVITLTVTTKFEGAAVSSVSAAYKIGDAAEQAVNISNDNTVTIGGLTVKLTTDDNGNFTGAVYPDFVVSGVEVSPDSQTINVGEPAASYIFEVGGTSVVGTFDSNGQLVTAAVNGSSVLVNGVVNINNEKFAAFTLSDDKTTVEYYPAVVVSDNSVTLSNTDSILLDSTGNRLGMMLNGVVSGW